MSGLAEQRSYWHIHFRHTLMHLYDIKEFEWMHDAHGAKCEKSLGL